MSLINDIINHGIFPAPKPPRDSWSFGTVESVGTARVDVLLDGDTTAVSMATGAACTVGDRVLVILLGRSRMVVCVVKTT